MVKSPGSPSGPRSSTLCPRLPLPTSPKSPCNNRFSAPLFGLRAKGKTSPRKEEKVTLAEVFAMAHQAVKVVIPAQPQYFAFDYTSLSRPN